MKNENDEINPLYLIPGARVTIIDHDESFKEIAGVSKTDDEAYTIRFNIANAQRMYEASWVKGMAPFSAFKTGLFLHEISHIKYRSFDENPAVQNGVFLTIMNILLDSQCEYSFTKDHPGITKYFRLALAVLRRDTDMKQNTEVVKEIQKRIADLFYLTRFGVVRQGANIAFINFIHPFVLTSTRKDVKAVHTVSKIIYQYLTTDIKDEKSLQSIAESKTVIRAMKASDIKQAQNGEQIGSSSLSTIADDIQDGTFAAQGTTKIKDDDKDNAFYRETIMMYPHLIRAIRQAFKLRMNQPQLYHAVDGNLDMLRQQHAYHASFTGEASRDYTVSKLINKQLDVVVLRDVSASTSNIKEEYCRLIILLLAALSDLPGIRICQADFSDDALINLNFGEEVRQSKIYPRTVGGTQILPAYNLILPDSKTQTQKIHFIAPKRVGIVVTDGDISDNYRDKEQRMKSVLRFVVQKWEINKARAGTKKDDLRYTTLEDFPLDIAKWLLEVL